MAANAMLMGLVIVLSALSEADAFCATGVMQPVSAWMMRGRVELAIKEMQAARLRGRRSTATMPSSLRMEETPRVCVVRSSMMAADSEAAASKLRARGFVAEEVEEGFSPSSTGCSVYRWQASAGMFRLEPSAANNEELPRWVSVELSEETFLEEKGWGFIGRPGDGDDTEQMSAFDIDAANLEGTYTPAWGMRGRTIVGTVSALGYNITSMSVGEIDDAAAESGLCDVSRNVLLQGKTEEPGRKKTACGQRVAYGAGMHGTFCCAISGLPLFSSDSLTADTATSGWLSFSAPVHPTHVHTREDTGHGQVRTEALAARSNCHLGHFFSPNRSMSIFLAGPKP